ALREQTAAREHLAAEITRSREAAAGVDAARAAMEQARVVAAASRQVRALTGEATALADRRAGLRQRRDDARGHLLDLREPRLAWTACARCCTSRTAPVRACRQRWSRRPNAARPNGWHSSA